MGREGGVTTHPRVEEREHHNQATEILDSRWRGRQVEYLVAWEGEPGSENTWVPAEAINDRYLVEEFHSLFPDKPKPLARFWEEEFGTTDDKEDFVGFTASKRRKGRCQREKNQTGRPTPREEIGAGGKRVLNPQRMATAPSGDSQHHWPRKGTRLDQNVGPGVEGNFSQEGSWADMMRFHWRRVIFSHKCFFKKNEKNTF
uniref:Chromo domain-containing protein n=1 Tax=Podarcis muralis TaxID=64176 RepID=A0A670HP51_PODMU